MKRLHIHLKTRDLDQSISFYQTLLGKAPDRKEADYAKWLLDDPAANISISTHAHIDGVDHVGISLDTREDLEEIAMRLRDKGENLFEQEATTCCYAQSNKYWARDPQGAVWELFQTFGDSEDYGVTPERDLVPENANANAKPEACCA